MNREIPGYYYDEEQKRYFKIEHNRTAPAQASWSSGNVKRRRVESREAEVKREREARNAGRVKRAVRVWNEPLFGGCFLGREIGLGLGRLGMVEMEDMRREMWTMGLRGKGDLRMWPDVEPLAGDVTLMYIGGGETEEKSGLGVGYAVLNDESLMSSYIPRNGQDEINFGDAAVRYPRTNFRPNVETIHAPSLSSLSYHAPSHKMLLTSRQPDPNATIAYFSPRLSAESGEDQPTWRLGDMTSFTRISSPGPNPALPKSVNTLRPAPASSPLTAVAATDVGILKFQGDNLTWLTWCPPRKQIRHAHRSHGRGGRGQGRGRGWNPSFGGHSRQGNTNSLNNEEDAFPTHGEIFSLDFLAQNPAEVIAAGGRFSKICLFDMRCSERVDIRHKSSVAHVRSVGDYGVLAAGPKSAMAIYDVRFHSRSHPHPQNNGNDPALVAGRPVVTFPEYKNDPHLLQIGLDVSNVKGGGLGIVAAAHDDGTVGLFSLDTGRKLRSPVVNGIRMASPSTIGTPGGRVIKSLMFQTLPGDTIPSLFVGQGSVVKKYSFGMNYCKEGGVVSGDED